MTDMILKLCAFALLVAFLGVLIIWVPRLDLAIVLGATLVLTFIDFFVKNTPRG